MKCIIKAAFTLERFWKRPFSNRSRTTSFKCVYTDRFRTLKTGIRNDELIRAHDDRVTVDHVKPRVRWQERCRFQPHNRFCSLYEEIVAPFLQVSTFNCGFGSDRFPLVFSSFLCKR